MTIELIVARSRNGVIGNQGALPWRIPEDMKHFRATTMGCAVIMGRKTWESIGRPLPGRLNIIVTRQSGYEAVGAQIADSLPQAYRLAAQSERIMIIGGGEIYRQALADVQIAWVTEVDAAPEGDAHFDALDPQEWDATELSSLPANEMRPAVRFVKYVRKRMD